MACFSGWLLTFLMCHGHSFFCLGPPSAKEPHTLEHVLLVKLAAVVSPSPWGYRPSLGRLVHLHLGHHAGSKDGPDPVELFSAYFTLKPILFCDRAGRMLLYSQEETKPVHRELNDGGSLVSASSTLALSFCTKKIVSVHLLKLVWVGFLPLSPEDMGFAQNPSLPLQLTKFYSSYRFSSSKFCYSKRSILNA